MKTAKSLLTEAGLENTFWGQRIIEAESSEGFTNGDKAAAKSWITCACGKLDDHIPRDPEGVPRDRWLAHMGVTFNTFVRDNRYLGAAKKLIDIEKRAIEVLEEVQGSQ